MTLNHQRLLTRVYPANSKFRKFCGHALVLQMIIVVGLFSQTFAVRKTVAGTVHAAPPDVIVASLETARHDLEINTALETRIMVELARLRQNGQTPSDIITDYQSYLEHVRAILIENRRLVQQLESLHLQSTLSTSSRRISESEALQAMIDIPVPEKGLTDEVAVLDRELDASLAEFDDMLLEELKRIRENSSPKIDSLAQEAADAAERLRQKGIDIDANPLKTDPDQSRQQTTSEAESIQPPAGTASGESVRTDDPDPAATMEDSTAEKVESNRQKRTDRYDNRDDDIVARQLREAAEQETDPVLKEKLWQEYEAYKRAGG